MVAAHAAWVVAQRVVVHPASRRATAATAASSAPPRGSSVQQVNIVVIFPSLHTVITADQKSKADTLLHDGPFPATMKPTVYETIHLYFFHE